jgi:hypothetical protein
VTPLEFRKQLLISESEINRVHLAGDVAALAADVRVLTERARCYGSIASSATALVAGLAGFPCRKPATGGAKPSWPQFIFKVAGLASSVCQAFRPHGRQGKPAQPDSHA